MDQGPSPAPWASTKQGFLRVAWVPTVLWKGEARRGRGRESGLGPALRLTCGYRRVPNGLPTFRFTFRRLDRCREGEGWCRRRKPRMWKEIQSLCESSVGQVRFRTGPRNKRHTGSPSGTGTGGLDMWLYPPSRTDTPRHSQLPLAWRGLGTSRTRTSGEPAQS